ncbi:MAG: response regulator [Candidatus Saccharibacteria bacterium]
MPKILTVDDSAILRKIIAGCVQAMGYELLEAKDGLDALAVLSRCDVNDVALILLDWNMPVMNGYEFLIRLKATEEFKRLKVMMVTTESEKTSVIQAIQAGACHYITKPFTQEELSKRIMEALAKGV